MKKVVRAVSLMLLMAGVCGNAFAEENENIVRQGAIRGRVIDNGKQILPGASIFVENLKTGVISDVNGFYTLPNPYPCQYFFHSSNHHQRFHILIFRNLFLNLHSFSRHNILPA